MSNLVHLISVDINIQWFEFRGACSSAVINKEVHLVMQRCSGSALNIVRINSVE